MAQYEHLPIYRRAVELCVYLDTAVRNFSRYHKYGIGSQLREVAFDVLRLIIRANNLPNPNNRADALVQLRLRIEETKSLCVIAKELKAFASFKSFGHASELIVDLARQNEGWLKQQKSREKKLTMGHPKALP